MINPYENQNALKVLLNLEQEYGHWVEATRATQKSLLWRKRGDKQYLYQREHGMTGPIETSLGP